MHTFLIVDLHADLLCYLEKDPKRSPFDLESRCSIPQLKKGNVIWQTLPIFTHTKKGSSLSALRQINCFKELKARKDLNFLVSIENGSSFFEEEEALSLGLKRAQDFLSCTTPLYISLTWKFENRLGGGNMTNIGLKKDGEVFLEFLQDKNIAIDLSHTSDKLAFDILNYLDKKRLNIIPIASHSNFRRVQNNNRNLSDEFAKEILKRGGVVGINFVCSMVGNSSKELIKHIEHALYLKLKDNICFGADFFDDLDFAKKEIFFFDDVQNAESYPYILDFLSNHFDKDFLEKLSNKNALQFFRKQKVIE